MKATTGRKGSLEFINGGHHGPCRLWAAGGGYISRHGGYTDTARKAAVFSGPGTAIAEAQRRGFAVTRW